MFSKAGHELGFGHGILADFVASCWMSSRVGGIMEGEARLKQKESDILANPDLI